MAVILAGSHQQMSSNLEHESQRQVASLSKQEKEILEQLTNGASIRSIAAYFAIDIRDAGRLIEDLMANLSVSSTADLVRIGLEANVAQQP